MMDARLVIEKGRSPVRSVRLRHPVTIIGRRRDATLRVASSEVSRQHCRIFMEQAGYLTVEDLDSANGTHINGTEIAGREVLRPGDHLQVGPVTFVVEYQLTQAALDCMLGEDVELVEAEEVDEAVPNAAEEDETAAVELEESEEEFLIPIDDEVATVEDVGWDLPEAEELRDILTNLEGPDKPKGPRKKK